ncbi:MAG: dihydropteroate synthase [Gloeomargarita sp. SKYBB_i_bin120]|nr:dihydropteroate synthase [Gloeomargarita sp. SKYG98]MCS7292880.1 dihydropteroate synthase [Gloeomargarita sp. SKYB120]MDW8178443.1 dihydropteroate synthase [Gloeomargarita sp. SKYBB_i_bin120]
MNWGQRTYLMGIVNVTPDSFSDGGEYFAPELAVAHGQRLVAEGADILDIGGQSTRPGAEIVPVEEELRRVIPVIEALAPRVNVPISVDTTRAVVARAALAAGATWVNDVSGGTDDPELLSVVAQAQATVVLMHRRGTPKTMQTLTHYDDLIGEIRDFLEQQVRKAQQLGIERIVIDPGIGFAKTADQNLTILRELHRFKTLNCPILVGPSRKSFIGHVLNQPDPKQRVWGTAAACCAAIAHGADILRVHDVAPMKQVIQMADAIWRGYSY